MAAWFLSGILMGTNYYMINNMLFGLFMFQEMISIHRKVDKDSINVLTGPALEWCIYFLCLYFYTPRINLRPSVLRNSGYGSKDYPILHAILHEWRLTITASGTLLIFIWFIFSLQRGAYRYQFTRFGFATINAIFIAYATNCLTTLMHLGRVWAIFVPAIVAINDSSAYFVGMSMGKTPLIKLSPNKTMEGFLGGAILTLWMTFLCVDQLLAIDYLLCPTDKLTWAPFEQ